MTHPTPLTLEQTTTYSVEEVFADDPSLRRWRVVLAYENELAELIRTQFKPRLWPEYDEASRSELLWAFLPVLRERLCSPALWRSRRLLPEAQQHAAETLSYRLKSGQGGLPGAFIVQPDAYQEAGIVAQPVKNRMGTWPTFPLPLLLVCLLLVVITLKWFILLPLLLVGVGWGLLRRFQPRPVIIRQVLMPLPVLADVGTQAVLLTDPSVRELSFELERNLSRAEHSSDASWRYNARAALNEYLPDTLRLHGERQGQPDDPEFQAALAHIRQIATQGNQDTELRWDAHERFLEEKVRSLKPGE